MRPDVPEASSWAVWYALPAQHGWPFYFFLRRQGERVRLRAHLDGTLDIACRRDRAGQLPLAFAC